MVESLARIKSRQAASRAAFRRAMIEKSTIQNLFSSNSVALVISRGGAVHSRTATALVIWRIGYRISTIGFDTVGCRTHRNNQRPGSTTLFLGRNRKIFV